MILPYISAVTREVLLAVPRSQREAALALGATRWEMIWDAVLPYARSGIIGGMILGLGRALGETMAVTMVIGNRHEISASLFAPGYTMASLIANEFSEATNDLHVSALMAVGAGLFVVTIIVNVIARWLVWRTTRIAEELTMTAATAPAPRGDAPLARIATCSRRARARTLARRRVVNHVMVGADVSRRARRDAAAACSFSVTCSSRARRRSTGTSSRRCRRRPARPAAAWRTRSSARGILVSIASRRSDCRSASAPGCILAEQRGTQLANVVRFLSDVLNGLPSIVLGIFAWQMLVRPFKHFSALAGGIALARDDDSARHARDGRDDSPRAGLAARSGAGARLHASGARRSASCCARRCRAS